MIDTKYFKYLNRVYFTIFNRYIGHSYIFNNISTIIPFQEKSPSQFWFATGGAGYCISRNLAMKMAPFAA